MEIADFNIEWDLAGYSTINLGPDLRSANIDPGSDYLVEVVAVQRLSPHGGRAEGFGIEWVVVDAPPGLELNVGHAAFTFVAVNGFAPPRHLHALADVLGARPGDPSGTMLALLGRRALADAIRESENAGAGVRLSNLRLQPLPEPRAALLPEDLWR